MTSPHFETERAETQKLLDSIDVETYLDREGIDYKASYGTRGLQLNLRECPTCGEGGNKTYINAETGLGNCFHGACNKKFNRFWLLQAVSGLTGAAFASYVKDVAAQQSWMPKKVHAPLVRAELKLPSKTHKLPIQGCNLQYLKDRGITLDTCIDFDLQFSEGWWTYKLGDGTEKFVSFKDRVIVPIYDLAGQMVSFQGRDITGEQLPKYLFPVGFAVAGSHLYNANAFVDGETTHLVVGEGAFDAFSIHQALVGTGLQHVLPVATFGMHLSGGPDGQVEKFKLLQARGLKTVTFLWDGEAKAVKAAVKAGLELRGLGLTVRVALLPDGKDPNEVPPRQVLVAIAGAVTLTPLTAIKLIAKLGVSRG